MRYLSPDLVRHARVANDVAAFDIGVKRRVWLEHVVSLILTPLPPDPLSL